LRSFESMSVEDTFDVLFTFVNLTVDCVAEAATSVFQAAANSKHASFEAALHQNKKLCSVNFVAKN
jgi:hypothetical protein